MFLSHTWAGSTHFCFYISLHFPNAFTIRRPPSATLVSKTVARGNKVDLAEACNSLTCKLTYTKHADGGFSVRNGDTKTQKRSFDSTEKLHRP